MRYITNKLCEYGDVHLMKSMQNLGPSFQGIFDIIIGINYESFETFSIGIAFIQ